MNNINSRIKDSSVIMIASFVIIFTGVFFARSIITPFILAIFISIICAPPISWLEKKRFPKWLALAIVMLGVMIIFSGFAVLIGGALSTFTNNLSSYENALSSIMQSVVQYLNERGILIPINQLSDFIHPAKVFGYAASAVNELFNMMGNTFLVFLIILFILMESGSFSLKAIAISSGGVTSISYFSIIVQNIRHYLWIKTLISLLTGFLIYIGLVIIGVDYPVMWAIIAFLLNYIPNIGSIIAAIPAVLFALVQLDLYASIWTLIVFLLVNNILGNFIEPRVMGKGIGLSTMVVFLSLLFWGFIFGTVGMFLSVPITVAFKIILQNNKKTRWLALLLGTTNEAVINLRHKGILQRIQKRKSGFNQKES